MCFLALFLFFSISTAHNLQERSTEFKFSKYYADHMVLQQGDKTTIWGTSGRIGDTVNILMSGQNVGSTTVGSNGVWQATIPPVRCPGPFEITAQSSVGNVTIHDVLFGDVWICSGQSNMEFTVNQLIDSNQEFSDAVNYPKIRVFKVHHKASWSTVSDVGNITPWSLASRASLRDFSAVCWVYAKELSKKLGYPIGLVEANWGGTPIEAWSSPDAIRKCRSTGRKKRSASPYSHNTLYNGMIYPLLRNTIKGAIWYQGEANANRANAYACQFPAMIDDWRQKFSSASKKTTNSNFPFGFVQLAPDRPAYSRGFTELRWSQTAQVGYVPNSLMPNTFMAVAIDLPDLYSPYGSIHPRYKRDIAQRLALAALAVAYKKPGYDYKGPFPSSYDINGQTLTIEFDNGKTPITLKSKSGLEICCTSSKRTCSTNDSGWRNAAIVRNTESAVVLDIQSCRHIGGVRYLWRLSPCTFKKCAVYGRDSNLPAPPFKNYSPLL